MRTEKEVQKWLSTNTISDDEVFSIHTWLSNCAEYNEKFNVTCSRGGKTLQDVIDFVYSQSEPDSTSILNQIEKIEKELRKLKKML